MHGVSDSPASSRAHAPNAYRGRAVFFLVPFLLLLPMTLEAENMTPPHASVGRNCEFRVSNGSTFDVNADLGSVRIDTLPLSAPPVLRYSVHIETEAAEPLAPKE